MIAVLKIGSTNELVLIEDKKLYFAFSLNRSTILNDTFKYLKSLPKNIDELRIIITPTIMGSEVSCDGMTLNQFNCGSIRKTAYISKIDVEKLKLLAVKLGLREFKLYNMFDFLKLIGKRKPAIISGIYLDRYMYTVYVDRTGIKSFRESEKPDYHDILDVQKFSDTDFAISELNVELAANVRNEYENIDDMNDDELKKIYMLLLTHYVTPAKVIGTSSAIDNITDPLIELDSDIPEEPLPPQPKPVEKKRDFEPKYVEHVKLNYCLDGAAFLLSIVLGFSAYGNIQLKSENTVLHDKLTQIESVYKPMKDNLNYYDGYIKVLQSGNSSDLKFIEDLNSIKMDGVLGEVVFNKENIGVQVYLAKGRTDEETKVAIENYKDELSKFMNITEVKEDTGASIEGATLVKIVIQGVLR